MIVLDAIMAIAKIAISETNFRLLTKIPFGCWDIDGSCLTFYLRSKLYKELLLKETLLLDILKLTKVGWRWQELIDSKEDTSIRKLHNGRKALI